MNKFLVVSMIFLSSLTSCANLGNLPLKDILVKSSVLKTAKFSVLIKTNQNNFMAKSDSIATLTLKTLVANIKIKAPDGKEDVLKQIEKTTEANSAKLNLELPLDYLVTLDILVKDAKGVVYLKGNSTLKVVEKANYEIKMESVGVNNIPLVNNVATIDLSDKRPTQVAEPQAYFSDVETENPITLPFFIDNGDKASTTTPQNPSGNINPPADNADKASTTTPQNPSGNINPPADNADKASTTTPQNPSGNINPPSIAVPVITLLNANGSFTNITSTWRAKVYSQLKKNPWNNNTLLLTISKEGGNFTEEGTILLYLDNTLFKKYLYQKGDGQPEILIDAKKGTHTVKAVLITASNSRLETTTQTLSYKYE